MGLDLGWCEIGMRVREGGKKGTHKRRLNEDHKKKPRICLARQVDTTGKGKEYKQAELKA